MNKKIQSIFNPKSICVIGASEDKEKVGYAVIHNIMESGYKGKVYPINIKRDSILGIKAYKSVLDVPGDVELAVFCIPSRFVNPVLKQCGEKKVKGAIIITAGFKEVGGKGIEMEKELVETAKKYDINFIGPNCLGVITHHYNASFACKQPKKGQIAMISQSGAMMTAILDWSHGRPIGFSQFISVGNKADIDEVDLIKACAADEKTKVIICYLESIKDGKKFLKEIPKISIKKPIMILKSGVSEKGAHAANSHTGALAGADTSFESCFYKTGVIRAKKMSDMFDFSITLSKAQSSYAGGSKFAIVTNAGGPGIILTDLFDKHKVDLATIPEETKKELKTGKFLPKEASVNNPIDIVGDAGPDRYDFALRTIFKQPNEVIAGALVLVTPQCQTNPDGVADVLLKIAKDFPKKYVGAVLMGGESFKGIKKKLLYSSIPFFNFPERAVRAVMLYGIYFKYKKRLLERKPNGHKYSTNVNYKRVREILDNVKKEKRNNLYSFESSEIFTNYEIVHPKTRLCKKVEDVKKICDEIGFPIVLKIVSPQIVHKLDCGGVIMSIRDYESAEKGFKSIIENVKKNRPNANIVGIEFQEMIVKKKYKKSSEVIVGVSRDPGFGPMLMFGSGGKYANYVKDVAFDIAYDFHSEDAMLMLKKTNIYTILEGVRNEGKSDIKQVVLIICKISQLVNEFQQIKELDINPLLVFEEGKGINAVDIKINIDLQK